MALHGDAVRKYQINIILQPIPLPPSLIKGRGSAGQRGVCPSLKSLSSPLMKGRGIKSEGLVNNSPDNSCLGRNIAVHLWFSVVLYQGMQESAKCFQPRPGLPDC